LASPKEEELAEILAHIEPVKIGALFYRTVSFRYASSVDSVNGAIECGGRFNPPYRLVRELCSLTDGFGYLYTASNPLTCLFECSHVLRGLGNDDFQSVFVEPTLLVCFKVESDNVLDLRNPAVQQLLGLSEWDLSALDHRAVLNARGSLTQLQALGVAVYRSGRFSGILTPSRFADVIPSFCFSFLPHEVRCELQDSGGLLSNSRKTGTVSGVPP
jgi:RES domain-containing protein